MIGGAGKKVGGLAAVPELKKKKSRGFLSHDLSKASKEDNRAVLVFSLHAADKEGSLRSKTPASLMLQGAGGLAL